MANIFPASPSASSASRVDGTITGPDISMEASFHSPGIKGRDLISQMRDGRHQPLFRTPFAERKPARQNEFTPLLRSTTRNFSHQAQSHMTPSQSRPSHIVSTPIPESREPTGSIADIDRTPRAPDPNNSSLLSLRNSMSRNRGNGGVLGNGNTLSLKEQESVCTSTFYYLYLG